MQFIPFARPAPTLSLIPSLRFCYQVPTQQIIDPRYHVPTQPSEQPISSINSPLTLVSLSSLDPFTTFHHTPSFPMCLVYDTQNKIFVSLFITSLTTIPNFPSPPPSGRHWQPSSNIHRHRIIDWTIHSCCSLNLDKSV